MLTQLIIPNKYINASLKDFPEDVLKQITEKTKSSFYIMGEPNTGKSHLAWALYKNHYDNEKLYKPLTIGIFVNALTLKFEIADANKEGSENSPYKLLQKYSNTGLLIIDDISAVEKITDYTFEMFYQIINSRYENERQIIFTSNVPLDMLKFDERIVRRIEEISQLIWLTERHLTNK